MSGFEEVTARAEALRQLALLRDETDGSLRDGTGLSGDRHLGFALQGGDRIER